MLNICICDIYMLIYLKIGLFLECIYRRGRLLFILTVSGGREEELCWT